MGEAKVGEEFVKHEFDEAIAIQQVIVDAESKLSTTHPVASAKRVVRAALTEDRRFLKELQTLGKEHDATGEVEDVAGGLKELMEQTLETASTEGADSDYYEAHAVLLNLKRKQMDSAGGMLKIARDREGHGAAPRRDRVPEGPEVELPGARRRAGRLRRPDRGRRLPLTAATRRRRGAVTVCDTTGPSPGAPGRDDDPRRRLVLARRPAQRSR